MSVTSSSDERPPLEGRRWAPSPSRAGAAAYVTALLMTAIDMQIVNVALPTLSSDFNAPLSDVQWTVISYLLTLAVVIPASGWIGDRRAPGDAEFAHVRFFDFTGDVAGLGLRRVRQFPVRRDAFGGFRGGFGFFGFRCFGFRRRSRRFGFGGRFRARARTAAAARRGDHRDRDESYRRPEHLPPRLELPGHHHSFHRIRSMPSRSSFEGHP